jgi:hypothetical protein
MFLRKVDFISPPITIFYKGESSHTSIFSGILSLIIYGFTFIFGIIFFAYYSKWKKIYINSVYIRMERLIISGV